jgi:nitrous oxide reductase accessory protein NosL
MVRAKFVVGNATAGSEGLEEAVPALKERQSQSEAAANEGGVFFVRKYGSLLAGELEATVTHVTH